MRTLMMSVAAGVLTITLAACSLYFKENTRSNEQTIDAGPENPDAGEAKPDASPLDPCGDAGVLVDAGPGDVAVDAPVDADW